MRNRQSHAALAVALASLLMPIAGCASSGGSVTGTPNRTRSVNVGEEVVIRLPASTTTREWRLTLFDSKKLPVTTRPRLEGGDGERAREWVSRFVARAPGNADIEFTRSAVGPNAAGFVGERRRFSFRIR